MQDKIALVKRAIPQARTVEMDCGDIIIDGFLRIAEGQIEQKSIRSSMMVPGFSGFIDDEWGSEEIAMSRVFGEVLTAVAAKHGGWFANQVLDQVGTEEFAAQCNLEKALGYIL